MARWAAVGENQTLKRTGFILASSPQLDSSSLHLRNVGSDAPLDPGETGLSMMTPIPSSARLTTSQVFTESSVEYNVHELLCECAPWCFQLNRLENHPLNSPTTGDVSNRLCVWTLLKGGERATGEGRIDNVERFLLNDGSSSGGAEK